MNNTLDLDAATASKEFHHYMIEVLFTVDFSPESTYIIRSAVTGQNIKIKNISISETGDTSTPYFMVVPFDAIEPNALLDSSRDVNYIKLDSAVPSVSDYIIIKKDVPLFPKRFTSGNPLFPLSFGSAVPANGLNYLVVKDFIGPVYAVFSPEKSELAVNPTNTIINNFHSISQKETSIFQGNDLYLSEGEGLAIVAAAEPLSDVAASTAQQVNKFGMGKYEYNIHFTVEYITRTLILTGLVANSEARIYTHNTTTELAGIENSSITFSYQYVYENNTYIDIVIIHNQYQYYKIDNLLLTNSDTVISVQQIIDRVYSNI